MSDTVFAYKSTNITYSWLNPVNITIYRAASVAEVRALMATTGNPNWIMTRGYWTAGDGGHGTFWLDTSDTTTPDNGGTVLVTANGARYKLLNTNCYNVRQFGAKGDGVTDDTARIQAAIDSRDPSTAGSWQLDVPDGTYLISGTGTRILSIQSGLKILGQSLEGTRFKVAAGSTAPYALEDEGGGAGGAKIELYNLTIDVNNNANVTSGLRLGRNTIQFGTYGSLDNIMVRGSTRSDFIGFDIDANVVACGRLYVLNATGSGLISYDAGTGLHIQDFTPLGWTNLGISLAAGDVVDYAEFEAPGSDDSIAVKFSRGGTLQSWVLSIQANRTMKTAMQIDPTYVSDFWLGPGKIVRAGVLNSANTARWGDTTSPAASGTATSGAANYVEDTSKTWTIDQFKGGMIFITGGTGSGQALPIVSNTKNRVVTGTWTTPPDNTSQYKIDYFLKKVGGGGYAASESGTFYWPAAYNISVTNSARIHQLSHGLESFDGPASTIASGGTIAPTRPVTFISGVTLISTITPPGDIATQGGRITLIPTGLWSMNTAGNIALGVTAVVSRHLDLIYDPTTQKWYPSYV